MFPIETGWYAGSEALGIARDIIADPVAAVTGRTEGVSIFMGVRRPTLFNWSEPDLWMVGDIEKTAGRLRQAVLMATVRFYIGLAAYLATLLGGLIRDLGASRSDAPDPAHDEDVATPRILAPGGKTAVFLPLC